MTNYMCYKIKLVNPGIVIRTMLSEGSIAETIRSELKKMNLPCENVIVERYDYGSEKMMGESMTPDEYRAMKKRK